MTRATETIRSFSHSRPDGRSFATAYTDLGGNYWCLGENIAYGYGSPAAVMNGWMTSPGHKANILTPGYTHIGVGVATDINGNLYWVQLFLG